MTFALPLKIQNYYGIHLDEINASINIFLTRFHPFREKCNKPIAFMINILYHIIDETISLEASKPFREHSAVHEGDELEKVYELRTENEKKKRK